MPKLDGLAYDGSNEAQKRELNAWERDVVCRVIGDYLRFYYEPGAMRPPTREEAVMLCEVRYVLDPRE